MAVWTHLKLQAARGNHQVNGIPGERAFEVGIVSTLTRTRTRRSTAASHPQSQGKLCRLRPAGAEEWWTAGRLRWPAWRLAPGYFCRHRHSSRGGSQAGIRSGLTPPEFSDISISGRVGRGVSQGIEIRSMASDPIQCIGQTIRTVEGRAPGLFRDLIHGQCGWRFAVAPRPGAWRVPTASSSESPRPHCRANRRRTPSAPMG